MQGFLKFPRSFLSWEFYKIPSVKILYLHLVLLSTFSDYAYNGQNLRAGQVWTSVRRLAADTGLTVKQVRYALAYLEGHSEIHTEGHTNGTLITIAKWALFSVPEVSRGTAKGTQRGEHEKIINKNNNKYIYSPKKNQFTNYKQRKYDYAAIEKKALEKLHWDSGDIKALEKKALERRLQEYRESKSLCETQTSQIVDNVENRV